MEHAEPIKYLPYTGIGSRETPKEALLKISKLSETLAYRGYTLRSGGANGADSAFESTARANKEIFLPWEGFNNNQSPYKTVGPKALELAATIHPAWNKLTDPVRKLMARNCYQILGVKLDSPSLFVICWTNDGAEAEYQVTSSTGGTGFAIKLANRNKIPVINIKNGFNNCLIKLNRYTGINMFEEPAIKQLLSHAPNC